MILDRGLQFAVGLMKELNKMLGIEIKLSTAFHSQTDGQIERTKQELKQYLKMYINYKQSNWSEQLATVEFAFNNKVYTAMKSSPFKVTIEENQGWALK